MSDDVLKKIIDRLPTGQIYMIWPDGSVQIINREYYNRLIKLIRNKNKKPTI